MKQRTITIDGRILKADPEHTILEAARRNGIDIPTLCFSDTLHERGSCWLCIVEIKGLNRFIPACSTKISEGMVIETDNAEILEMRRRSLERLVAAHCGDCLAPCELSCPAGCNIPGFTGAIAAGQDRDALRIIRETIPLAGILGRVCPAPCEEACRRHGVDEPLSICALKRFAADAEMADGETLIPQQREASGKRVAVVGAGPAGLTAAYYLLAAGHGVTIIDAHEKAGGMMRYGIPKFRLPDAVIDADIAPIIRMGAAFLMSTTFGIDTGWESLSKDHDALFIAIGASAPSPLDIPGDDAPEVVSGIGFLHEVAAGKRTTAPDPVIVVGGGNTAIDAARTALRLGAGRVTVMYRRGRSEMPANPVEIEEAEAEGISFRFLTAPTQIDRRADGVLLVQAVAMRLGEPDDSGRRRPVPVEGSETETVAGMVIAATGQKVDLPASDLSGIGTMRNGSLQVDPATMQSSIPGIFAGGDCVSGPDLAVQAVAHGRKAAEAIDRFLRGLTPSGEVVSFNSTYGERDSAPLRFYEQTAPASRVTMHALPEEERHTGFAEVMRGFSQVEARQESARCMQCRCLAVDDCRLRELANRFGIDTPATPPEEEEFSINSVGTMRLEREKCVDCGICVRTIEAAGNDLPDFALLIESCPTGAISAKKG